MQTFIPGQRWISSTELQMGLGAVLETDHRSVTIVFLATGETRIYAKESAPLSRVSFGPGDTVLSHEDWGLTIESVTESEGLITYHGIREDGESTELKEIDLNNFIQLNRPTDRLFNGQIDKNKWFELRYQTLQHINRLTHSDLRGLTGARTSLIPHQLYIAHEVANRYAPRVLLADEVGLGKTIEAGLILHHQLLTERAQRILIVVPETLIHQWLVEMLRRFNFRFSIFNEERCLAAEESAGQDNPFHTEQLVLCSLDFLVKYPNRFEQALGGQWDLLIVDEAHHLQWSPEHKSVEYDIVEKLSMAISGVLLLTATPEQLGKSSHFARLRLLDPDRFHDFDAFVEEEKTYEPIATAVETLLEAKPLNQKIYQSLVGTLDEGDNLEHLKIILNHQDNEDTSEIDQARQALVEHLLDRHGTGRVLFRNTRSTVKGFPVRQIIKYPLPLPTPYSEAYDQYKETGVTEPQLMLSPERLYNCDEKQHQHWAEFDTRVTWLRTKLKELKKEKVLVITSSAMTALDLSENLRVKEGIHAAVFYEGLSIVERDRAAAYFADQEYGTQVLVCSEIGSEGRNFQFAHHLVLFDLPYNPDLLEQRIGRLDRIGQTETIKIHVPYLENSPQEVMYKWYQFGLQAFEHTCPAGHNVFVEVESTLMEALHQFDEGILDIDALTETTKKIHDEYNQTLVRGRNRLLEYNSCRPSIAKQLEQQGQALDEDDSLNNFMESIFDCYGIDSEVHADNSFVIRPSDHMQTQSFPGLNDEGMTITYDRTTALTYEDMDFITWAHPLVSGALDMVLDDEKGNTAVIAIKHKHFKPGALLLESIYVLESSGISSSQANRHLPPTIIRNLLNASQKDISKSVSNEIINKSMIRINKETANKVIRSQANSIRELINKSEQFAQQKSPAIISKSQQQATDLLQKEVDRLIALQQVNPNVRHDEIEFYQSQIDSLDNIFNTANPRLEALRVIVTT